MRKEIIAFLNTFPKEFYPVNIDPTTFNYDMELIKSEFEKLANEHLIEFKNFPNSDGFTVKKLF